MPAGCGLCQMLRPNTTPRAPASSVSRTTWSTARSLSIFGPPAISTGAGQPAVTLWKLSALPVA